jgi:hypothetical protein
MIDGFIRGMLGTSGTAILDFYISNSFWINALILLYALAVVLSRRAFESSRQSLLAALHTQYGARLEYRRRDSMLGILKKINIPWDQALEHVSFPFLCRPGSFWIYRKNPGTLQRLFPLEDLAELLTKH